MDIQNLFRFKVSAPSKLDEAIYEWIANELSSNQVKQGLWTKALTDCDWNEAKAKAKYVKMRHEQLIFEINNASHQSGKSATSYANQEAIEYGLTTDEIEYLQVPIKAVRYIDKYKKTKEQIADAISKKKIHAVMKNEILWVTDKPF